MGRLAMAYLSWGLAILILGSAVSAGAVFAGITPLDRFQEDINATISGVRPWVAGVRALNPRPAPGIEIIGSGVVVDRSGYILTNYHVVDQASEISVTLWRAASGTYRARLVKKDPAMDLALLHIQGAGPLIPARFGDSDKVSAGDLVLAAGAPFGFEHSFTLGTLSAGKRYFEIGGQIYRGMLQTDAVINEGNSGGALTDIQGRLIGINTAIYAPDSTYTGLGFAIPVNRARAFFTPVTGAVPVAGTKAALKFPAVTPTQAFPIDITQGRPNDFNHINFRDCTHCHVIRVKSPAATGIRRPHPYVGACGKCHVLPVQKAGLTAAAAVVPPDLSYHRDTWFFFTRVLVKAIPLFLISSVIFSMLGLGGGFFYVPILIMCHLDFHTAATTSLLMITAGSLSAVRVFVKSGMVDYKLVTALGGPAIIGAFAGGFFSTAFTPLLLYVFFSVTLFGAAFLMVQEEGITAGRIYHLEASPLVLYRQFNGADYAIDLVLAGALVTGVGFIGGLLGIAGGWFLVPMLVLFFAIPIRIAIATSSFIVPLSGVAGFAGHGIAGHINWQLTLPLCVLAVIGAQIGARISIKTDAGILRVIFAFILSLVGVWMLAKNVITM
ncbi:MAG: TSUP family transporter [Desulfobacterales bacterium]|nr:TSUP family transporter [Desulfobacterales bacterium]